MVDLSPVEQADVMRGLTKQDLQELGAIASEQEFKCRDCLFKRGDEANSLYIATRGRFALTVELRVFEKCAEIAVEEMGVLDAFGWSSLVEPRSSIYSGYCTEDGAVIAFPREPLEALMQSNSRLGEELLHNLNELIGSRVRILQDLWLDEISHSMARVKHWSHTALTNQFTSVMTEPGTGTHAVGHWFRRHTHNSNTS